MSTVKNFWDSFVPAEAKEARFGLIPAGKNKVHILCVQSILASQNFHLDDKGQIVGLEPKKDFNMAFDQDVLAVVFQDEEGRVLIDRRSEKGFLTADEKDDKGMIKATAEMVQRNGLVASGARFINKKGIGVTSKDKTASCVDMASRLFNAGLATNLSELLDSEMIIDVKSKQFDGKDRNEVIGYYPLTYVFKDKTATVATTASVPAAPVLVEEPEEAEF